MASHIPRRFFTTTTRRLVAKKTEEKAAADASQVPPIALGAAVLAVFGGAFYFRQGDDAGPEVPWDEATLAKHKLDQQAPSALNAVVVPNMTLPKDVHDRLNKYGKDGYP